MGSGNEPGNDELKEQALEMSKRGLTAALRAAH